MDLSKSLNVPSQNKSIHLECKIDGAWGFQCLWYLCREREKVIKPWNIVKLNDERKTANTVDIRIPDWSVIQITENCLNLEWSIFETCLKNWTGSTRCDFWTGNRSPKSCSDNFLEIAWWPLAAIGIAISNQTVLAFECPGFGSLLKSNSEGIQIFVCVCLTLTVVSLYLS